MKMKLSEIPQEVIDEYKLETKVTPDGFVCIEIRHAMYGLKKLWNASQQGTQSCA
jgi:hypothetical protein